MNLVSLANVFNTSLIVCNISTHGKLVNGKYYLLTYEQLITDNNFATY